MDSYPASMVSATWSATLRSVEPAIATDPPTHRTESERNALITHATRVARGATVFALGICLPTLLLSWWFLLNGDILEFGDIGTFLRFLVTLLWLVVFLTGAYLLLVVAVGHAALARRLQSEPAVQAAQGTTLYRAPSAHPAGIEPVTPATPEPPVAHTAPSVPAPPVSPLRSSFSEQPLEERPGRFATSTGHDTTDADTARIDSTPTRSDQPRNDVAQTTASAPGFDLNSWLETPAGQEHVRFTAMATTQCQLVSAVDAAWDAAVADIGFNWLAAQGDTLDSMADALKSAANDAERDAANAHIDDFRRRGVQELGFDPVDTRRPPQWKPAWVDPYIAELTSYLSRCVSDGPAAAGPAPKLKVLEPIDVSTIKHPTLSALVTKSFGTSL